VEVIGSNPIGPPILNFIRHSHLDVGDDLLLSLQPDAQPDIKSQAFLRTGDEKSSPPRGRIGRVSALLFSLLAARECLNLHSVIIGIAVQPKSLDWRGVSDAKKRLMLPPGVERRSGK
jgi:hypothetical protein